MKLSKYELFSSQLYVLCTDMIIVFPVMFGNKELHLLCAHGQI